MKNPIRYWRTGAVAVVLAALGGAGYADDVGAFDETSLQCLSSPFDVDETVHRIGISARQRGMPVFACVEQRGAGGARIARGAARASDTRVVVLESVQGGTPVLMAAGGSDGSAIELPLSIRVRPRGGGQCEVWVEVMRRDAELLPGLTRDLAELDAVVRDALGA